MSMMVQRQMSFGFPEELEEMERSCAWCGRFRDPDGSWVEPSSARLVRLTTHGLCPACAAEMTRDITSGNRN